MELTEEQYAMLEMKTRKVLAEVLDNIDDYQIFLPNGNVEAPEDLIDDLLKHNCRCSRCDDEYWELRDTAAEARCTIVKRITAEMRG